MLSDGKVTLWWQRIRAVVLAVLKPAPAANLPDQSQGLQSPWVSKKMMSWCH